MEYTQIKLSRDGMVGIITLNNPPRNSFSKRMLKEVYEAFKEFETDDTIRTVYMQSTGKNFSAGADADDIRKAFSGQAEEITESFSELGSQLVECIDNYPKGTIVAARGLVVGGSTAIYSAFDIRIAGEGLRIHDGDIYYATVGSWGMSSLRLPIWIGRNKMMDYMFLNEDFTGQQAYELGIVSKVVPDDEVYDIGLQIAKKMSTAGPIAVRYFKECVRKAIYGAFNDARAYEVETAKIVGATEDSKEGLLAVIQGKQAEFKGK
ncbi:MAG: enoyl-CoA hydratase/isomerase family protein [Solobacterium sp.]|nr:enoyl-CoA hydratase/isomerase family protein [Solobacterium sp.]